MARTGAWLRAGALAATLSLAGALLPGAPASAAVGVGGVPLTAWRIIGTTQAVRVLDGVVYVGGDFSQVVAPDGSTRSRRNLAAFDATTGALIEGFQADTNGVVRALAADGDTLWLGGSFTAVRGSTRNRLAAVDSATGALRPFNPNANKIVYAMDLRAGRLFAAGVFDWIGGMARNRAAAMDPTTGAVDPQFAPQPNNTLHGIRANPTGSVVWLAGNFTGVGGTARNGVVGVSGVTGALTGPAFGNTYVNTLGLDANADGTRLYAAVGGAGNQVAAFNTSTGTRIWSRRADGDVQAVGYHDGTVYWGFHESFGGDTTLRLLASDADSGAVDPDFRPSFDRFWGVRAIAATAGTVAVAGDFTRIAGVPAQGLGLFVASGAPPPPPPADPVRYVGSETTWRYLAQNSAPDPAWRQPGYADADWPAGPPQLGYGDGDEATVVPYGPNPGDKYLTTYFRANFIVPEVPAALILSLLADDGAIVYLNGVEVVRDNMPAGTVGHTTLASTNRSGAAENMFRDFPVDPARLVAGENTIAVEVHQDYRASSDLSLDVRLTGTPAG